MFENRVLRRILGPKRDEVTGEWRKLNNEELNELYCSTNIIHVTKSRIMIWAGHVDRMGDWREVYGALVGLLEGKRPLGKTMRGREDNIKLDLQELVCECMEWIGLAENRDRWRALVGSVTKLRVP